MPPPDDPARQPRATRLLDLLSLTVGYGLAGLLIRAFWPPGNGLPTIGIGVALGFLYLWLGLAMGGPLVLLRDRRTGDRPGGPSRYTWAELAWLLIGMYWIALAVLVVPIRLRVTPLLGVFPVVVGVGLRVFAGSDRLGPGSKAAWTHQAGLWLLITWLPAWADLVLLGKTLF